MQASVQSAPSLPEPEPSFLSLHDDLQRNILNRLDFESKTSANKVILDKTSGLALDLASDLSCSTLHTDANLELDADGLITMRMLTPFPPRQRFYFDR